MAEDGADQGQKEVLAMLDAFGSVGATHFELTITTRNETKESYQRRVKLAELSRAAHAMLDRAASQQHNVIVRPHGAGVSFVQLDDLKAGMLARLRRPRFSSCKPRRGIFRHGSRSPEPRTRSLPAACAKEPEPTPLPAAQRASPAV
jgi:hypothetical protein